MFRFKSMPTETNKKTEYNLNDGFPIYNSIENYYAKMGFPNAKINLYQNDKNKFILNNEVDCGDCEFCLKGEDCDCRDTLPPIPSFSDIATFNDQEYQDKKKQKVEDERLAKLKADLIKLNVAFKS